jgi:hypothetical protein
MFLAQKNEKCGLKKYDKVVSKSKMKKKTSTEEFINEVH